jgi:transposase-like protein
MEAVTERDRVESPAWAGAERREGERSEPERGVAQGHAGRGTPVAGERNTEVRPRARRRTFTVGYKLRILRQADACKQPGQLGALLRREGLYSSHLAAWRRERDRGAVKALVSRKRGPKGPSPEAKRVVELERENQRLREELRRAQLINEAQKKLHELLGIPLPDASESARS